GNAIRGQAFPPATLSMVVANPEDSAFSYAPRPSAFVVVGGALPPGLVLGVNGTLGGAPTTLGNFVFRVEAQDSNGFTASREFAMTIGGTDPSAPVLAPVVTGTAGSDGWYRSDVTLAWAATDPESQVSLSTSCATAQFTAETA